MRAVKTSTSTPLTCRSGQLRRLIRRAPPFTDRMSNGSFARTPPLACILVTLTFRIVQAGGTAAAATRRGSTVCRHSRGVRVAFLVRADRATNVGAKSFGRASSPRRCRVRLLRNRLAKVRRPEHFVLPVDVLSATWWFVSTFVRRSEYWRSTVFICCSLLSSASRHVAIEQVHHYPIVK